MERYTRDRITCACGNEKTKDISSHCSQVVTLRSALETDNKQHKNEGCLLKKVLCANTNSESLENIFYYKIQIPCQCVRQIM